MNKTQEKKLSTLLHSVAKEHKVDAIEIVGSRRSDVLLAARRKFFVAATQDLGLSGMKVADAIGWTAPAVYYHLKKWREAQSVKSRKKAA